MACNVLWTTCVSIRVCIVYSVMWGLKPVASDLALSSLPLCDLITTPKLSVTVVPPLHSPHHTHLTSLQDNTTTTAAQHRKRTTTTITKSTTHQYDDNHCKHNYFDRLEEKCFWSLSSNVMAWIYYLSGLSPMNYFISDTFVAAVQPVNRFVCFSKNICDVFFSQILLSSEVKPGPRSGVPGRDGQCCCLRALQGDSDPWHLTLTSWSRWSALRPGTSASSMTGPQPTPSLVTATSPSTTGGSGLSSKSSRFLEGYIGLSITRWLTDGHNI